MAPRGRAKPASSPKPSSAITLTEIARIEQSGKANHLKAARTNSKYASNVRAARTWLQDHFKAAQTPNDSNSDGFQMGLQNLPPSISDIEADVDENESFTHPEFKEAFNDIPNRFSDRALALYITFKCMHEGRKEGTGASIRAAFKHVWEQSCGTKYRGKWQQNPLTGLWEGNPVESASVSDVMTAVKNKTHAGGGDRTHSIAMSARFMDKIYQWSRNECDTSVTAITMEQRQNKTKHLMYRAFSVLAWQIWARCFELVKLQKKDVALNQENERAFNLRYHRVHLRDRKGWQRKLSKTEREPDLRSNTYHLYDDNEIPGCNAYQVLREWIEFLEGEVYHRPLCPDDYIFPAMGANGVIQPGEPVTHDTIQKYIREFTVGAGVADGQVGSFSTHCFRRGGAQYFHLFAPDGKRWHLRKVRWWGGWAEGEHRDTLIRYLLDELHSYEESYTDAQCPIPQDIDGNFQSLGAPNVAPVTVMGMQAMSATMCNKMEDMSLKLTREFQETICTLRQELGPTGAMPASGRRSVNDGSNIQWILCPVPTGYQYPEMPALPSLGTAPHQVPFNPVAPPLPVAPSPTVTYPPATSMACHAPSPLSSSMQPEPTYSLPPPCAGPIIVMPPPTDSCTPRAKPLPTHNLIIPDIPVHLTPTTRARRSDSWKWIVKHWNDGDPERGLVTPLKDWDREWLQGPNKELLAAKHGQRRVIAVEYLEQYDGNDEAFLSAYPEAEKGHSALYAAIQKARELRGDLIRRQRLSGRS